MSTQATETKQLPPSVRLNNLKAVFETNTKSAIIDVLMIAFVSPVITADFLAEIKWDKKLLKGGVAVGLSTVSQWILSDKGEAYKQLFLVAMGDDGDREKAAKTIWKAVESRVYLARPMFDALNAFDPDAKAAEKVDTIIEQAEKPAEKVDTIIEQAEKPAVTKRK